MAGSLAKNGTSALALMRSAAERFDSAAVQLSFQQQLVRVTDEDFDTASAPANQMPSDLDADGIRAVQAARTVRSLSHEQRSHVAAAAKAGSREAERVIAGLVLDKLCTMRRAARRVMLKALDGDASAKQLVEDTFVSALQTDDRAMRNRAYLAACMLRDALRLAMLPPAEEAEEAEEEEEAGGDADGDEASDAAPFEGAPSNDVADPASESRDGPETRDTTCDDGSSPVECDGYVGQTEPPQANAEVMP